MLTRFRLYLSSYIKISLILPFILIGYSTSLAQSTAVDSLQSVLKTEKNTCLLVETNINLAWEFLYDDIKIAEKYALTAVRISGKCKDKRTQSNAYSTLGTSYLIRNLSSEALKNYFTSLKLKEEVKDFKGMATIYNNVGIAYRYLDDYENALRYYNKGLKITLDLKKNPGDDYHNIALCHHLKEDYHKATIFEKQALDQYIIFNDSSEFSGCYMGLALNYIELDSFDLAISYLDLANDLVIHFNDRRTQGGVYLNYATAYRGKNDFVNALKYAKLGYDLTQGEYSNFDWHKNALLELSLAHSGLGNMSKAFKYHLEYGVLKDSLMNKEKIREATTLDLSYDFEKKQLADSLVYQDKIHSEKLKTAAEQLKTANQRKLNWLLLAIGGLLVLSLIGAFIAYRNKRKSAEVISAEREKSEKLLLNILPALTAEELKATGTSKPRPYQNVSIIFTDFKGFTMAAEKLTAEELVYEIDHCFKAFDEIIGNYPIEKIKTIGDAYMCAGGLPSVNDTHPTDMVNAALDIRDWMLAYKKERELAGRLAFEIRIGVHSGPVVSGIVGTKKFAYDIWGDTVNTASRMESSGQVGKVNISGTTQALVENSFKSEHRGKIEAKNKGQIDMYFVERL